MSFAHKYKIKSAFQANPLFMNKAELFVKHWNSYLTLAIATIWKSMNAHPIKQWTG